MRQEPNILDRYEPMAGEDLELGLESLRENLENEAEFKEQVPEHESSQDTDEQEPALSQEETYKQIALQKVFQEKGRGKIEDWAFTDFYTHKGHQIRERKLWDLADNETSFTEKVEAQGDAENHHLTLDLLCEQPGEAILLPDFEQETDTERIIICTVAIADEEGFVSYIGLEYRETKEATEPAMREHENEKTVPEEVTTTEEQVTSSEAGLDPDQIDSEESIDLEAVEGRVDESLTLAADRLPQAEITEIPLEIGNENDVDSSAYAWPEQEVQEGAPAHSYQESVDSRAEAGRDTGITMQFPNTEGTKTNPSVELPGVNVNALEPAIGESGAGEKVAQERVITLPELAGSAQFAQEVNEAPVSVPVEREVYEEARTIPAQEVARAVLQEVRREEPVAAEEVSILENAGHKEEREAKAEQVNEEVPSEVVMRHEQPLEAVRTGNAEDAVSIERPIELTKEEPTVSSEEETPREQANEEAAQEMHIGKEDRVEVPLKDGIKSEVFVGYDEKAEELIKVRHREENAKEPPQGRENEIDSLTRTLAELFSEPIFAQEERIARSEMKTEEPILEERREPRQEGPVRTIERRSPVQTGASVLRAQPINTDEEPERDARAASYGGIVMHRSV